jgi:hypothetical protein
MKKPIEEFSMHRSRHALPQNALCDACLSEKETKKLENASRAVAHVMKKPRTT